MASLKRQLGIFALGVLVTIGFMVILTPPSNMTGETHTITTAGSTTVFILSQEWATRFQHDFPAFTVNPSTGGSGLGQSQVARQLIDIGASSSYPDTEYLDENPHVRILPISADALGIVINPAINGTSFKMDCDMAVAVFQRNITTWESFGSTFGVSIMRTGPINVYVRSDASGTTATFAKWLETADSNPNPLANYTWNLGHSETLSWMPGTNSVDGNPGVASSVTNDNQGIGYVGLAFLGDLTKASLYNPGNEEYVAPSVQNALKAIPETLVDPGTNFMNSAALGAYPIARLLYYVVHDQNTYWEVIVYLNWVLTRGQTHIAPVGYVPINGTSAAIYSMNIVSSLNITYVAPGG